MPPRDPESSATSPWLPPWALHLGAPVWITDPRQRVVFVNDRAAMLFGEDPASCEGRCCFEVVAGLASDGRPFCRHDCTVAQCAARAMAVPPQRLQIRGRERPGNWAQVMVIPTEAPDGTGQRLVHIAISSRRESRFEQFLTKVAERSPNAAPRSRLTLREREVLEHLARDEDLPTIAKRLFVSHTTVRNHVQHILEKLGVHSVLEAIALHLLARDGTSEE